MVFTIPYRTNTITFPLWVTGSITWVRHDQSGCLLSISVPLLLLPFFQPNTSKEKHPFLCQKWPSSSSHCDWTLCPPSTWAQPPALLPSGQHRAGILAATRSLQRNCWPHSLLPCYDTICSPPPSACSLGGPLMLQDHSYCRWGYCYPSPGLDIIPHCRSGPTHLCPPPAHPPGLIAVCNPL